MLSNPKPNQIVRVWYGKQARASMPYHGQVGSIAVVSKGRPRNHGVLLPAVPGKNSKSAVIAVPCGNIERLEVVQDHLIHARRTAGGWMASLARYKAPRTGDFVGGRFVYNEQLYVRLLGDWRTVVGVMPTRAAAIELAITSVQMQGAAALNPAPDARDRRRKLWWHQEAERRRQGVGV